MLCNLVAVFVFNESFFSLFKGIRAPPFLLLFFVIRICVCMCIYINFFFCLYLRACSFVCCFLLFVCLRFLSVVVSVSVSVCCLLFPRGVDVVAPCSFYG